MTGETSRTAPGHVVGFDAPSGHKYYLDPTTQQPTWDAPAQAAWKEGHVRAPRKALHVFALGCFFAYKHGAYARADCTLWRAQSKEHDRAYFYNHVTKERSWTRPADSNLAWVRFHEEL